MDESSVTAFANVCGNDDDSWPEEPLLSPPAIARAIPPHDRLVKVADTAAKHAETQAESGTKNSCRPASECAQCCYRSGRFNNDR